MKAEIKKSRDMKATDQREERANQDSGMDRNVVNVVYILV